jgi:hypothetical protein
MFGEVFAKPIKYKLRSTLSLKLGSLRQAYKVQIAVDLVSKIYYTDKCLLKQTEVKACCNLRRLLRIALNEIYSSNKRGRTYVG